MTEFRSHSGTGADAEAPGQDRARFPWGPVFSVLALVLLHFTIVAWHQGAFPGGQGLLARGGLRVGGAAEEPWRLLSSIFLHGDVRHAFWNGVSLMVFAVPLIGWLGYLRASAIYLLAGIGGSLAALQLAPQGTLIVGSSGAVAGLFGAWVTVAARSAGWAPIPWRARVRAVGVGLLVLPSLLNPLTSEGQPVSVSSHLGGMFTGMLIGILLSRGLAGRPADDALDDEVEEYWH